jgi:hypothetical protein
METELMKRQNWVTMALRRDEAHFSWQIVDIASSRFADICAVDQNQVR